MKKEELKKILKPLIKECIREVLFQEDGALSHVIKEVTLGLSDKQTITETKQYKSIQTPPKGNVKLKNQKKKLLDAIGKDAYNGVNVFEGTTPTAAPASHGQAQGPLNGVSPNDPGVDISNLFGAKAFAMSQRLMENK
jgi:hypothetical protein